METHFRNLKPLAPASVGPISVSSATVISVPAGTYSFTLQAVGGTLYYTIDGSTPSASAYHGYLSQDESRDFPIAYADSLNFKVIGTSYAVTPYSL